MSDHAAAPLPVTEPTTTREFRLARMDALNAGLTVVVAVMPLLIMAPAFLSAAFGQPGTPLLLVGGLTGAVALFVVAMMAGVALYARPTRFVLSPEGLRVVWPVRTRLVPLANIESVEVVDRAGFRSRYGMGVRIGAGGFLGGFGWLKTERQTFVFYISRVDRLVIVHVMTGKSWVITPERPDEMVRALRALRALPGQS